MKEVRIRQLMKLEKALQMDGYEVMPRINDAKNLLMIIVKLKSNNDKEIMSQWNDLRKVNGG